MRRIFWLALIFFGQQLVVRAQEPVITITPLVMGVPINEMNILDTKSLQNIDKPMLKETLALLKLGDIDPDSCEFITEEENFRYATKLKTWDFSYTFCNISLEDGVIRPSISMNYNGFAKTLRKPKICISYGKSKDGLNQIVTIYYYRGLAPEVSKRTTN